MVTYQNGYLLTSHAKVILKQNKEENGIIEKSVTEQSVISNQQSESVMEII
jgi:hypothetical protein